MKWSALIPLVLMGVLVGAGCNEKKEFSGDTGKQSPKPPQTNQPLPPPQQPLPPPPQCKNHETPVGAHLAFLVDNSSSMRDTDCPGRQVMGQWPNGQPRYVCTGVTNREKAILMTFDVLAQLRAQNQGSSASLSTVSVARFTPAQAGSAEFNVTLQPTNTEAGARSTLTQSFDFVRQPLGDTPYLNAARAADQLFAATDRAYGNDGKHRVAVMVTDGEATDRDPAQVRQLVQQLKSRGIEWYTIMVNNNVDRATRLARHRNTIQSYNDFYARPNGTTWWAPSYPSLDAYLQDIAALPQAISNSVIEVASSAQLQQTIYEQIITKKVDCR